MSTPTPPGWYPDPDDPTSLRFFDGTSWTTGRAPAFPDEIRRPAPDDPAPGEAPAEVTTGTTAETPTPGAPATHESAATGTTGDAATRTSADATRDSAADGARLQAPAPGSPAGPGGASSAGLPTLPPPSGGHAPPSSETYPPPSEGHPPPPGGYPPPSGGYPPSSGGHLPPPGGFPPPPGGYPPPPGSTGRPVRLGSDRRPLLIGVAVVLVVLVAIGGFLVLRGDEPRFEWQGDEIAEPEVVLEDAEAIVEALVDERNGALSDDSRCYFSLPEEEDTKDVNDWVRCGPVLFVDGDVDEPYLSFPLTAADGDGDLRLEVGERPVDPEPTALDPGERLERPDDQQHPEGAGGLEPPDPPPAPEDLLGVVDLGPTSTGTPPAGAVIGSLGASYELTTLASIDRYGQGDTARRPADGYQLIAFEVSEGLGEIAGSGSTPTVEVQIDDGTPRDVTGLIDGDNPVVVSAPEDAEAVDLVVTDGDLVQRLSLLDGTPGAGNLQVLTRTNRSQTIGQTHEVSVTGTDAIGSLPLTGTIEVAEVQLGWALQEDPTKRASSGDTALLVVVLNYNWPDVTPSDGGLAEQAFTLALPDGRAIPAVNLAPDPVNEVIIAFEVPADFTEGTLSIGGTSAQPGGLTIDFGGNVYQTAINIPAG